MAELKALQKKIAALLYTQLSKYFAQVKILSYKPSADGTVSGKFIGDRRSYTFILKNNQVQYLPSTAKMDSTALAVRPNKGVVQCTGSNHPCKGEKGTRCVPDSQSCKQREASPEGIARLKEISDASKEITALVTGKAAPEVKAQSKPSPDAPELDKDISLYDFMKYYSPWNAKGSQGFDKAKLRDVKRRGISNKKQGDVGTPSAKPEYESKSVNDKPKSEPSPKPKGLGGGNAKQSDQKTKPTNPYEFLGISPKDFPNEAALYKAAKVAYRNLAIKYHPDKGGDPKLMVELNDMMDKLKAMRKRTDSKMGFGNRRRTA